MPEPLSPKRYSELGGGCCPSCGAHERYYGKVEITDTYVTQEVQCLTCCAVWWDGYILTGYNHLTVPPGKPIVEVLRG